MIGDTVTLSVALPARATAGTGNPTLTTGDAPDSICPSGWRLPGYDGSGSYYDLAQKYNNGTGVNSYKDTFLQSPPLSFLRSGWYHYSGGAITDQKSSGTYWSNRYFSKTSLRGYYLYFSNNSLIPNYDDNSGRAFSLRCLAR